MPAPRRDMAGLAGARRGNLRKRRGGATAWTDRIHLATSVVQQRQHLPGKAAGIVDHRPPQRPRLPPAVVSAAVAKTDQHDQRRTEQGQRHQRQVQFGVEKQHEVDGDGDVPEQQPEQRPAHVTQGLDDQTVFFDDGSFQTETSWRAVCLNA